MAASTYHEKAADERGRRSTKPTDIPAAGWKDILWRVYQEIGDDRVTLVAAGVTFYLLLAFVPGLTALVSIYGFFADPATISSHLGMMEGIIPGGGMQILRDQLSRLAEQGQTALGFASLISIAIALWSANAGVKSLFEAMNVAYDEEEKRSFIKLNLVSLAFTLTGIAAVLLFLGLVVALPMALEILGFGEGAKWLVRIASFVAIFALLIVALACLYRWGPSREEAEWRWITPGAILTIVVTLIVSVLFSWYVANFGSYNATYGSLGALIGFMTWIWITMIILIVGGELNAEVEHQTARDTTTGPSAPMGRRGAVMADRLGKRYGSGDASEHEPVGGGQGATGSPAQQVRGRARMGAGPSRRYGSGDASEHSRQAGSPQPGRPAQWSLARLAIAAPVALMLAWLRRRRKY